MRLIIYLIVSFVILACSNSSSENNNTEDTTALNGINNNQWEIDSLELFYYPNPSDQKFFKNIIVKDSSVLNALEFNLSRENESFEECPHHVKMFLFKNGGVFKTIYVSDSCNYIAYAQNSNQQFIKMHDVVKEKIGSLKLLLQ